MTAVLPDDVAIAEARAAAARERLKGTIEALQTRVQPAAIAQDAIGTAKRYPGQIAGGAALLIAFFARRRLTRAAVRIVRRPTPTKTVAREVQPILIAPIKRIR